MVDFAHSAQCTLQCASVQVNSQMQLLLQSAPRIHKVCYAPSDTGHRCACLRSTIIVNAITIIVTFIIVVVVNIIITCKKVCCWKILDLSIGK